MGFYKIVLLLPLFFSSIFVSGQTINIHSVSTVRASLISDNGYTLDGQHMVSSVSKLENLANFSNKGIYKKTIEITNGYYESGSLEQITQSNNIDIFFFGSFLNMNSSQRFTQAEIDSLFKWSLNGGKMIIAEQRDQVRLRKNWNYFISGASRVSYPTEIGQSTLLFDGPFGLVSSFRQGGSATGYIVSSSSGFVALAESSPGKATVVFDCYTKDLIFADTDIFTHLGGITTSDSIENEQDIFWANTIAFMDSYQYLSGPALQYDGKYLKTDEYLSYQWLLDGNPIFGSNDQKFQPAIDGSYSIVVETDLGCIDTSDVFIYPYEELTVPNIITPNGDGLNDYLIIENLPRGSEFTVFTRDSKIVFQTDNYQNNWNGTDQQNTPLKNGTYWYVLKTLGKQKYSGYVVINK